MAEKETKRKKPFKFSDYWAAQVYRTTINGKDKIGALVFRKYSEQDVDNMGPGTYIGIAEEPVYKMITDNDPDSETFGQRIQSGESTRTRRVFNVDFTPETAKQYRELVGPSNMGVTRLIYIYREHPYIAQDEEEFFSKPMKELYNEVVLNKPQVVIKTESYEQVKSNIKNQKAK